MQASKQICTVRICMLRGEKFVMAHQQHQLSMVQRLLPSAKKVPGGNKGRVSMTLQDGATTSDILTGILQVSGLPLPSFLSTAQPILRACSQRFKAADCGRGLIIACVQHQGMIKQHQGNRVCRTC